MPSSHISSGTITSQQAISIQTISAFDESFRTISYRPSTPFVPIREKRSLSCGDESGPLKKNCYGSQMSSGLDVVTISHFIAGVGVLSSSSGPCQQIHPRILSDGSFGIPIVKRKIYRVKKTGIES